MNYYNKISKGYDELHKEEQLKKIEIIKKHLKINKTDKLLDVGCGPYYADWGCNVIGIDPSEEFVKKASEKIKCLKGKAENLPFDDNSFDVVVSVTSIQNFDDVEKGLKEIKRVGKNKFALTFLKKSEKKDFILEKIREIVGKVKIIEEEKDLIVVYS